MPPERSRRTEDSLLIELVELARSKGYAIDLSIIGGAHLDHHITGTRITAPSLDLADHFKRGIREIGKWPHNPERKAY